MTPTIPAALALAAIALAGCNAIASSPAELRAQAQAARTYRFAQAAPAVKACMVGELDRLKPFTLEPGTRPPSVRELGARTEIFAQDESVTLYLVELAPAGPRASSAAIYATRTAIADQLAGAARICGGQV